MTSPGTEMGIAVSHVITSLRRGGAEMMLLRLLRAMDRSRFRNSVITLTGEGEVAEKIRAAGIPVEVLDLRRGRALPGMSSLARSLRLQRPQIVQTWMYHADLFGGLASFAVPSARLVWNIRSGRLDPSIDKRSTIWISRACAAASGVPSRIICCSHASLEAHASAGYARGRMRVIPNGFDTAEFHPDPGARASLRAELGDPPDGVLVGMAARFDGAKDHRGFFEAAGLVLRADPRARFLLCGEGITDSNARLKEWISAAGISSRCHLLGARDDMPRILAALDVAVSSSVTEGFPNAIGEAMACAVPCVVTDVGDSRRIVGETGLIVPPGDPALLAKAICRMIDTGAPGRSALGALARQRIQERFGIAAVATQYSALYEELVSRCAA